MAEQTAQRELKRDISIDRFRGFIVFCMVFFIGAAEFPCLGFLARVANNSKTGRIMLFESLSLADLVNPIFLFLISLSYQHSFDRRYETLGKKAYLHFLVRYLCFMGAGSIMVSGEDVLIYGLRDPFLIQTILMFAVLALFACLLILRLIRSVPEKLRGAVRTAMTAALVFMGVFDLLLGLRDDFFVFTGADGATLFKHWSILHEIGLTGLLALLLVRCSLRGKIAVWLGVGVAYTAVQTLPGAIEKFDVVVLGGAAGTVGWLLVMLGGMILMALYEKGMRYYFPALGVLGVLAAASVRWLPIVSGAVTVNRLLVALFAAGVIFWFVNLWNRWDPPVKFLVWWGRNPLLLFLIGLLFRGALKLWDPAPDTPLPVAAAFIFGGAALFTGLAYLLYRKNIIVKF